jgi:DNA-binding transcriptional LysR family regulator
MTLDDLKVFIAVCNTRNLSAVARELGCTQPAVSQHVSRLEKELGVSLLERRPKGVAMTEAGRVLYEGAQEGLDAIAVTVRNIEQLREGESGSLGISTGGTTVKHFMRSTVVRFHHQYPRVSLYFQSANSHRRCIEALRQEKADLAFITMSSAMRGIDQYPLMEMPWVLVVPEKDSLSKRKSFEVSDLKGINYISLKESSTSQSLLKLSLVDSKINLKSSTQVDDWDTAILFVGMGMGYAIAPALHVYQLSRECGVVGIPLKGVPPVVFGWAARKWNSMSRVTKDFVTIFTDEMSQINDIPGFQVFPLTKVK